MKALTNSAESSGTEGNPFRNPILKGSFTFCERSFFCGFSHFAFSDFGAPAHIGNKHFGNTYVTVYLLVVLKNGCNSAADSDP